MEIVQTITLDWYFTKNMNQTITDDKNINHTIGSNFQK